MKVRWDDYSQYMEKYLRLWKIWKSDGMINPNIWKNTYPSEKYESQMGWLFPIWGKNTYPSQKFESQMGWLFPIYGKIPSPLKNMKVRWDDYSQHMEKYLPLWKIWKSDGMIIPNKGKNTYPSQKFESQMGWLFPIYGKKTYPSEKYESQMGWLFPIYGKYLPLWKIWKSDGMIIPNIWKILTPLKNMKVRWDD